MPNLNSKIPLSLYVHYPFCKHKCPYCDFYSIVKPHDSRVDLDYVTRLICEFKDYQKFLAGRKFISCFFGGGTPSLLSVEALELLFKEISPYFAKDCEITFEVNPGTLKKDFLKALKDAGVNRISLGAQSFNDEKLKALGRIHRAKAIFEALELIKDDFRVNLDLMHALPLQTHKEALEDLKTAIDTGVEHISWYELTLEEGTPFYDKPPLIYLDNDHKALLDEEGFALLKENGFSHYEVSAFTRKRRCLHNENYWRFGDYLGLGAGAHGKISLEDGILRTQNIDEVKTYLKEKAQFTTLTFDNDLEDLIFEYMLNRLRLFERCEFKELLFYLGLDNLPQSLNDTLHKAQDLGLVHLDPQGFEVSPRGHELLSDLMILFLPS